MADQETVRTAGETAIGDERAGVAEAGPHEGRGGLEHFYVVISICFG